MLDKFRTGARSFGVMLIFGIIIVVFVFWGVGNFSAPSSRTLAEINGEAITIEDFRPVFAQTVSQALESNPDLLGNEDSVKQIKRAVLEDLVKRKAILQAAEKVGIIVTPQEIRKAIDGLPQFHNKDGKFDKEVFALALASQRISQEDFLDEVAESLIQRKLFLYVQMSAGINEAEERGNYVFALEKRKAQYVLFKPEDYLDKVALGEDELRKEYEATRESYRTAQLVSLDYIPLTPESLAAAYPVSDAEAEDYYKGNMESFRKPERVLVRHIFVSYPVAGEHGRPLSKDDQQKAAREIMDKALADLKAGKDFADVAGEYSHDQASARNGGLLEWIVRGDIPIKEFEDTAFSLKKGETGGVVASSQGLHLIRAEDREEERLPDFAECREGIIKSLGMKKADADFADIHKLAEDGLALGTPFAELGEKLKAPVKQTGTVPQAEAEKTLALRDDGKKLLQEAVAGMLEGAGQDGLPQTNATQAVHPRQQAARTLPVPLSIEDGIVLVKINAVTPSYIKAFEEVRDSIATRMKAEKARVMARQEAEKALPAFTGKEVPEAYKDKVELSKDGARAFPILDPFGNAEQLIAGIFSSKGEWLPQVYETSLGTVIARCFSVDKVADAEWERWKDIFMPQRHEFRRNQVLQAFMDGLDENLTFTINTQLLDAVQADYR